MKKHTHVWYLLLGLLVGVGGSVVVIGGDLLAYATRHDDSPVLRVAILRNSFHTYTILHNGIDVGDVTIDLVEFPEADITSPRRLVEDGEVVGSIPYEYGIYTLTISYEGDSIARESVAKLG